MYCSACGKQIVANSKFCQHCGAAITESISGDLQWEYKEVIFPRGKYEGKTMQDVAREQRQIMYFKLSNTRSVSNVLNDIWMTIEQQLHGELKEEIAQGWEPDPNGWGPSCMEYQTRTVGMSHWSGGQWVGYFIISIATSGIGFLIGPFMWRSEILEPMRCKVRLRKLKQVGVREADSSKNK